MATLRRSPIVCDVGGVAADTIVVGVLARLQLGARRAGFELRFRNASRELEELVAFVGLREALRLEPRGQPEQGKERLGVEEERELDDPAP